MQENQKWLLTQTLMKYHVLPKTKSLTRSRIWVRTRTTEEPNQEDTILERNYKNDPGSRIVYRLLIHME